MSSPIDGSVMSRVKIPPTVLCAILLLSIPGAEAGDDVFNTQSQVPDGPAAPLLQNGDGTCRRTLISSPLALMEAIERSLCESPKTHVAWATVKAAAAQMGQSKAAYLPTLDGTISYATDHYDAAVTKQSGLQSNFSQPVNTEALTLGWLLYDFGGREAALKSSRLLLVAANANQNLILQAVFANTAKDYYTAQAAAAAVKSALRIESDTRQTLDAATARYRTGVAPITDQLQANTANAQAVFQRAKAEGALRIAVGTLAIDMSLSTDYPLQLPELDQSVLPDTSFVHAVHDLVEEAVQSHPSIVVARAQWKAALEEVRVARAQGLPKLSVAGTLSRSDQPLSASLGQPDYPAVTRQGSIGLSIEFPLFQGFAWEYKVRQAEALAETDAQALRDAELQVSVGIWSSFQTLQTATENLRNTDIVLQSARDSFDASEHRYQSGVGGILELLTAQSTLATAEQQQIQAQLDWRTARIQLAQSLGRLGLWTVQ